MSGPEAQASPRKESNPTESDIAISRLEKLYWETEDEELKGAINKVEEAIMVERETDPVEYKRVEE